MHPTGDGMNEPTTRGAWRRELVSAWSELDPRALGLFRIGFSLVLLVDLPNVGLFSPVMCWFFLLLPSAADFEALERRWSRRKKVRTVFFDASCGICFQTMRVLAWMDRTPPPGAGPGPGSMRRRKFLSWTAPEDPGVATR